MDLRAIAGGESHLDSLVELVPVHRHLRSVDFHERANGPNEALPFDLCLMENSATELVVELLRQSRRPERFIEGRSVAKEFAEHASRLAGRVHETVEECPKCLDE